MSYFLPLLMLVFMVGIFAALMREGMWSNAITFFNVVIAALLATNFFEPLADYLDDLVPGGTYLWDIIAVWVLFAAFLGLFKIITDRASTYAVRFRKPLDQIGGYFFAAWVAWVMLCFTTMTLHTAPLARNFFFGGFRPESPVFFVLKPDRLWLAWTQSLSRGAYERLQSAEEREAEKYVFDPRGEFMPKYATRRAQYALTDTLTGKKSQ